MFLYDYFSSPAIMPCATIPIKLFTLLPNKRDTAVTDGIRVLNH